MAFPRPRKLCTEDELYEYAVGALARRMRSVAELKRLLQRLAALTTCSAPRYKIECAGESREIVLSEKKRRLVAPGLGDSVLPGQQILKVAASSCGSDDRKKGMPPSGNQALQRMAPE